jgi:PhnB protein
MAITPYLSFPGTARQAFEFYEKVFGGEVSIFTYADMPSEESEGMSPDSVAHASLKFGDNSLMGADGPSDVTSTGMCAMYELSDDAEAERVFNALAEGGEVQMKIQPTSFASNYGMLRDKFGTPWMIYSANPEFAAQFQEQG